MEELNIFWFRRDLRLYDNSGLSEATSGKLKVIPLFIYDTSITDKLSHDDRRINFIYDNLKKMDEDLKKDLILLSLFSRVIQQKYSTK